MRLALAAAALVLAGCGMDQSRPPDVVTPEAPEGDKTVALDGVRFEAPGNWTELEPAPPLEGGVQSNSATVAVWRYPRTEPLPADRAQLRRARERLIERVQERDPSFTVRSSELTEIDDAQAIELLGQQTIAGLRFDVRSTHVFADGAEVVVDAYAPPDHFARVDSTVFAPLVESLSLR